MPPEANDVVAALLTDMSRFASAHPVAWVRREAGVAAYYSGVPIPMLNGVVAERDDADISVAAQMLDEIGATGVPCSVSVRSDDYAAFVELAESHGLTMRITEPLMVLDSLESVIDEALPGGLSVRALTPEDFDDHVEVAATSFEIPIEFARQLMIGEALRLDGACAYVGEYDGRLVATAMGLTTGHSVGVFNVGTLEDARGKGFGRALTARVIADGVTNGATWSYLQSSPAGFPVYRRLGFETVEEWSRYLPAEPGGESEASSRRAGAL